MFSFRSFHLVLAVIILSFSISYADVPQKISFQGMLDPVPGTSPVNVTFNIYDASDATESLWSETQPVSFDEKGVFNVNLGESTSLDLDFDSQYWIGIEIDDGEELSPRIPLVSVPYSLYSKVSGATSSLEAPVEITYAGSATTLKAENTSSGDGLKGQGTNGVYGISTANSGVGVYGHHNPTNNFGYLGGNDYGCYGYSNEFYGVYGKYQDSNWGAIGGNAFGVKGVYSSENNYGEIGTATAGIYASASTGYAVDANTYNGSGAFRGEHFSSHNEVEIANADYAVQAETRDDIAVYGFHDNSENDKTKGTLGSSTTGVWGWTNNSSKPAGKFEHSLGSYALIATQTYGVYGSLWGVNNFGYLGGYSYGVYGEHDDSGNFGFIGGEEEAIYAEHPGNFFKVGLASDDYLFYAESEQNEVGIYMDYDGKAITTVNGMNSCDIATSQYGVHAVGSSAGVYGQTTSSSSPGILGTGYPGVIGKNQTHQEVYTYLGHSLSGAYSQYSDVTNVYLATQDDAIEASHRDGTFANLAHSTYAGAFTNTSTDDYVELCTSTKAIDAEGDVSIAGETFSTTFRGGSITLSSSTNTSTLNVSGLTDFSGGLNVSNGGASITGNSEITGNLEVTGTLSKGGGSFKIDHPLDPKNKFLYHSFVESPEMMNIYRGNATLDENGEATISLPDYFQALNMEFSYQLTPIGKPAPMLHIAKEISNDQFAIAGGSPGQKVCWQVTGVRNDPYARNNRIEVEVEKADHQKGKYLHPEAYGENPEKKIMGR